tara:strand:- start:671 stop:1495 length:825 start_codon:yes stop_codon:yes gene_type:complete
MINVLSLGAGVQSSTLAMMFAKGELKPMPDFAVFADTQGEPKAVYQWLDWLETQLPYPVYRISKGNLAEEAIRVRTSKVTGKKYIGGSTIPVFLFKNGIRKGFLPRGCTNDFKIKPIRTFLRRHCKIKNKETNVQIHLMLGISTDEATRMKPSRVEWIKHTFPLIDNNISRADCLEWFTNNNLNLPPRSACIFCPYHSLSFWKDLKENSPDEFNQALEYEQKIKKAYKETDEFQDDIYDVSIHQYNDLKNVTVRKEKHEQLDLFTGECEGMCGV